MPRHVVRPFHPERGTYAAHMVEAAFKQALIFAQLVTRGLDEWREGTDREPDRSMACCRPPFPISFTVAKEPSR